MNTSQIEFTMTGKSPSQTDALINLLHESNGEWVSMVQLGEQIGAWAVHSRVADARRMGCNIENRIEVRTLVSGEKKRFSFYRLLAP
jgi:hypothetical protein